jgi:hypothetical protein
MSNENLREQIGVLRALAPGLNAVTDKAASLIQAVEHFLGEELRLSLSASVQMYASSDEHMSAVEEQTRLEYVRIDGKFRICIAESYHDYRDGSSSTTSRTLWDSCTRQEKLASVDYIPALLRAIAWKVKSTIEEGQKAAASVDQYLQEMGVGK